MKFKLETTINNLYEQGIISVRTRNCLYTAGLETLGIILDNINKPSDLKNLRNFGEKSYLEIEGILDELIKEQSIDSPERRLAQFEALGEKTVDIITKAYIAITEGETKVNAYLRKAYPQPYDLHHLVMGKLDNMLMVVKELSRDENIELRHSYKNFMDFVLEKMDETPKVHYASVYAKYKRTSLDFIGKMEHFSYEQIAENFLSETAKLYLKQIYDDQMNPQKSQLSVNAQNFMKRSVPNFSDLIKFADQPFNAYREICPERNANKALADIYQFNQGFTELFNEVKNLTDDEIHVRLIGRNYPFLSKEQCNFVFNFTKEHDHRPMLFLLLSYLCSSENSSNKAYSMIHGMVDGKPKTVNEIAETLQLTSSAVNVKTKSTIEAQRSLAKDENWQAKCYRDLSGLPFINEKSSYYKRLKEIEHLPDDFGIFAALVRLVKRVADFEIVKVEGHSILVNTNENFADLNIVECLNEIHRICNDKYSEDEYVPLDNIVSIVPERFRISVKELIKYVVTEIYDIQITEKEQLYLPQTGINVSKELYNILANNCKPMHLDEIFDAFKKRHPNHKYTDSSQIRPLLYLQKNIKPIGMTSSYAIDSWAGIHFGCIRDLLTNLLEASDEPLHIDKLYNGAKEHFPKTTKPSVRTTMTNDRAKRFVKFKDGFYGLRSKHYSSRFVEVIGQE